MTQQQQNTWYAIVAWGSVTRESLTAAPGRPILHQARRDAWREWKKQQGEPAK